MSKRVLVAEDEPNIIESLTFLLERAGFGRADKLAAQFYLRDLTVFKVMFSAIVPRKRIGD